MLVYKTLQLGDVLNNFSLKGTDQEMHSLTNYLTRKILVVVFLSNNSKHSHAYAQRLVTMQKHFEDKSVQFIAVNSNDVRYSAHDSLFHMADQVRKEKFNFPYLKDSDQKVAKYFDAICNPEAYVFDKQRKLAYRGRIDDNWSNPLGVKVNYVSKAIRQIIHDKKVAMQETPPIGDTIKWHY